MLPLLAAATIATTQLDANVTHLSRTINLDLAMYGSEAAEDWGKRVEPKHLAAIRRAGFTAIRLPIRWEHFTASKPPYRVDPAFYPRVNRIIDLARHEGLAVILDNHKDKALCADPAANHDRFLALWDQLGAYYRNLPPDVMFEPFAEPHDKLDKVWNTYFAEALARIRATNPDRTVLVGPALYNHPKALSHLRLPADDALVVVIHDYTPLRFTFQGEDVPGLDSRAWRGTRFDATPPQAAGITADLDAAEAWGKAHARPVFLEEFGATDYADLASRARYLRLVRESAERRHMPWGVWAFGPTYSLYDLGRDRWRPGLVEALVPGDRP